MFDKKQKRVKRIHLVTDGFLYDWKAFWKLKVVFINPFSTAYSSTVSGDKIGFTYLAKKYIDVFVTAKIVRNFYVL